MNKVVCLFCLTVDSDIKLMDLPEAHNLHFQYSYNYISYNKSWGDTHCRVAHQGCLFVPENMILETFLDDNHTYCRSGPVLRVVKERVKKKENNSFCNISFMH